MPPIFFFFFAMKQLKFERPADSRDQIRYTVLPATLCISKYIWLMFHFFLKFLSCFILQIFLLRICTSKQCLACQ